jgi:hypothetical protein
MNSGMTRQVADLKAPRNKGYIQIGRAVCEKLAHPLHRVLQLTAIARVRRPVDQWRSFGQHRPG